MERRGRFARDVVLAGLADALRVGRAFVVMPILARLLGPEDYGVWGQVKVTAACLAPLALLGLNGATVRFVAGDHRGPETRTALTAAFGTAALTAALAGLVLLVGDRTTAQLIFHGPGAVAFVRFAALFVLLEALDQLALAYFQALRQTGTHLALMVAETVVEVTLVCALSMAGQDVVTVLLALGAWKTGIVALRLGRIAWQSGFGMPRLASVTPWLRFGLPIAGSSLFYLVVNYADRFLINGLLGTADVGVYSVAYTLGLLPMVLATPIDYVVYPSLAQAWARQRLDDVRAHAESAIRYILLVTVPVVAALATLPGPMVTAFSSAAFAAAAACVPWIALGFLLLAVGVVGERVLTVAGRARTVASIYAALAMLNVAVNLLLIPRMGIAGAAVATALTYAVYAGIMLGLANRIVTMGLRTTVLWKPVLAAGLVTACLYPLGASSTAGIAAAVLGGAGLYVGMLVALRGVDLRALASRQ